MGEDLIKIVIFIKVLNFISMIYYLFQSLGLVFKMGT